MKFSFITLFPDLISSYFNESILFRAKENGLISIDFINPRDFSQDKHNKVDLPMLGGGAGMLMMPEPLISSIRSIKSEGCRVIMLSPVGKKFTQNDAIRLSSFSHLILISGRYEGIDERVIESEVDEVFSIGDFVLTGGELASLVVCDSVARNIVGVLGNSDSLSGESFEENLLEAPAFTKPDIFEEKLIISEYLKGNHSKITALKRALSLCKTKYFRPDLFIKVAKKASNYEK
ncbi:MAG: tRNA (guanosine(37)-N1)-methyltransferase TrmD [Sulfurovaceae bacterium]|nr:tRNA (guanosine(37)-N1)-methyltransferase TrmD [Sulfurovaceae bacterium]MDD5548049.1 tRNA (guanosine(37)-N1)-methyltransferase TrmD [Sulfurovaceae bacterium]